MSKVIFQADVLFETYSQNGLTPLIRHNRVKSPRFAARSSFDRFLPCFSRRRDLVLCAPSLSVTQVDRMSVQAVGRECW